MGLLTIKFTILDVFLRLGRCELIISNELLQSQNERRECVRNMGLLESLHLMFGIFSVLIWIYLIHFFLSQRKLLSF